MDQDNFRLVYLIDSIFPKKHLHQTADESMDYILVLGLLLIIDMAYAFPNYPLCAQEKALGE